MPDGSAYRALAATGRDMDLLAELAAATGHDLRPGDHGRLRLAGRRSAGSGGGRWRLELDADRALQRSATTAQLFARRWRSPAVATAHLLAGLADGPAGAAPPAP